MNLWINTAKKNILGKLMIDHDRPLDFGGIEKPQVWMKPREEDSEIGSVQSQHEPTRGRQAKLLGCYSEP